ncbi:MAG: cytidylate kinase [unclassified Hahellaceae]|nr:cytidylate kinase [Hahellaceae bacterium]|tara:strand:- start:753 stop:1502 length:750 start_codon:yes stop_codon:yes gene_type:complete
MIHAPDQQANSERSKTLSTGNPTAPVVTIDGPSGSGKGTLAVSLARRLNWRVLDSGALYRITALSASKQGVDLSQAEAVAKIAHTLDVSFEAGEAGQPLRVILGQQDITAEIRTEQCGAMASTIAVYPEVRLALLQRQRAFQEAPGLVADGRDMGTVVFPDARFKFYVTASAEVRAQRRYQQLKQQGEIVRLPHLLREIQKRDERDTQRAEAPLLPAKDALVIDTSELPALQVLDYVAEIVEKTLNQNP